MVPEIYEVQVFWEKGGCIFQVVKPLGSLSHMWDALTWMQHPCIAAMKTANLISHCGPGEWGSITVVNGDIRNSLNQSINVPG